MSFSNIELHITQGVARITLDRPDALNSFNTEMHGELKAALDQVDADEQVRCLILTGSGRGFCAGQDLNDRAVAPGEAMPDLGDSLENYYNPLIRRLTTARYPVICAVNGVAAGAGANIALACDLVIAARSASFIQAFCKIGLIPDSGGTWMLPRLVGMARAKGLALLGDRVTAEEAEKMGLIWKCVDDEALRDTAMALGIHLASQPTKGLVKIRETMHAGMDQSLDTHLDMERDVQRELGRTDDYSEGVAAFMNKRSPQFRGQ